MNIQSLKTFNADKVLDVDELVAHAADARALTQEFTEHELPVPAWLQAASDTINSEIARQTHASDLAAMQALERELDSYKSTNERKAEAQKKLAQIQKRLGMTPARA